ncbi:hypothetical protein [Glaciimonas sp. PCH181]|uniref:hypothetical protein n=1 Tax=Glaciimonas sp. PCH181 TaxID=2133943 RepID=UPI000D34ACD8|nr:hypothetical protein [Glaciimonas sp. PCH181]PUA16326.1 hypothetical protein C7W93_23695 [Glaciimonas sp. PCH181]
MYIPSASRSLPAPFQILLDIGIDTSALPCSLPARLSGAHNATAINLEPPVALPSLSAAAWAACARDSLCTAAGAAARYGVSAGLQTLTSASNISVTILGSTVGAFSWAYVGAGLAGSMVPEKYAGNRDVKRAAVLLGGVIGGLAGAAPSLVGYGAHAVVNAPAIKTIASVFYGVVRDPLQIALNGVFGPRCVWLGEPRFLGVAATALASVIPLTIVGVATPYLPVWASAIFGATIIGGLDGISGVIIRGKLFQNYSQVVAGSGKLAVPTLIQVSTAATMRIATSGLALSQNMVLDGLGLQPEQPNLAGMVGRYPAMSSKVRPWIAFKVQDGLAKTFKAESWNCVSSDVESTRPVTQWGERTARGNVRLKGIRQLVSERNEPDSLVVMRLD